MMFLGPERHSVSLLRKLSARGRMGLPQCLETLLQVIEDRRAIARGFGSVPRP